MNSPISLLSSSKPAIPSLSFVSQSFRYTLSDPRKLVSLSLVVLMPVLANAWRFVPNDIPFYNYYDLGTFIYTFVNALMVMLMAVAWFLVLPRRDFAMQIIASAGVFFGFFLAYDTLPFTAQTPLWLDITIIAGVFVLVSFYLYYVHRTFVHKKINHKQLYDGLLHDLHHEKILNTVSRLQGLIELNEMDEPYHSMCQEELQKLREGITYLNTKYSDLQ